MDTRATARSLSDGRAAVGAACFAAPELTTRVWIGDDAGRTGARLLAPAPGAREVVLGAAHAALGRSCAGPALDRLRRSVRRPHADAARPLAARRRRAGGRARRERAAMAAALER